MKQEVAKKQWHNGGGLYRGLQVPVKLLNYMILFLMIALVCVVVYLGKTSHFQVSYEVNGGTPIAATSCKHGDTIIPPKTSKPGYEFAGWYLDEALDKPWHSDIIVEQSGTLYAKWTNKEIKIIFDAGDGELTSELVTFDQPYGKLPVPAKPGFVGWYYDGAIINEDTLVKMNGEHVLTAYYQ